MKKKIIIIVSILLLLSILTVLILLLPKENKMVALSFDANGGNGYMESISAESGETIKLPYNKFSKYQYTFDGWSTSKEGIADFDDGTDYTVGDDSSYTLYAVWKPVEYTIEYVLNGGVNNKNNKAIYTIEDWPLKLDDPERENYAFLGWFFDSSFTQEFTLIKSPKNLTVYAKWSEISFTVYDTYAEVKGCSGEMESIVIPSHYQGKPVTSIARDAFENCTSLKNITIPNTVTTIGDGAFTRVYNLYYQGTIEDWCKNPLYRVMWYADHFFIDGIELTEITIPQSITEIKEHTFDGFENVTTFNLHSGITKICNAAFRNCSKLKEINIPLGITEICSGAFSSCTALTKVTGCKNVLYIGQTVFEFCDKLEIVEIGNKIISIGFNTFYGCDNLQFYEYNNAYYLGNSECNYSVLYRSVSKNITECEIHPDTKIIYDYAFNRCDKLSSITLPHNITSIGTEAFYKCEALTTVINNSLLYIEQGQSWHTEGEKSVYSYVGRYASEIRNTCVYIATFKSGSTVIARCTFTKDNKNIIEPEVPIIQCQQGQWEAYVLGDHDITINAIYTTRHESLRMLPGIEKNDCFDENGKANYWYCDDCEKKFLDSNGDTQFTNDDKIKLTSGCVFVNGVCKWCNGNEGLLYGYDRQDGYYVQGLGECTSTNIVIPSCYNGHAITKIGWSAFYNTNITSVVISQYVTQIDGGAFWNCTELLEVGFRGSITSIEPSTFCGCSKLKNIDIPNGVKTIGAYAFEYCYELISVNLPDTLESIGVGAFSSCKKLQIITIPVSVVSVESNAFKNCWLLTINCEAAMLPSTWNENWNPSSCTVIWNSKN